MNVIAGRATSRRRAARSRRRAARRGTPARRASPAAPRRRGRGPSRRRGARSRGPSPRRRRRPPSAPPRRRNAGRPVSSCSIAIWKWWPGRRLVEGDRGDLVELPLRRLVRVEVVLARPRAVEGRRHVEGRRRLLLAVRLDRHARRSWRAAADRSTAARRRRRARSAPTASSMSLAGSSVWLAGSARGPPRGRTGRRGRADARSRPSPPRSSRGRRGRTRGPPPRWRRPSSASRMLEPIGGVAVRRGADARLLARVRLVLVGEEVMELLERRRDARSTRARAPGRAPHRRRPAPCRRPASWRPARQACARSARSRGAPGSLRSCARRAGPRAACRCAARPGSGRRRGGRAAARASRESPAGWYWATITGSVATPADVVDRQLVEASARAPPGCCRRP